jgi:quercetin dioxygenase-like cupin family protein
MNITRASDARKSLKPADPAHFTGKAGLSDLIRASPQAVSIFGAVVRFEAGARNHWHSHPGGQLLHVIEGEGWVQVRGQAPQRIRQEDTVTADPGEEHWHGAGSHGPMTHIAVAAGETRWLEESAPPPE